MNGNPILWKHFKDAYAFNQSYRGINVHEKLTTQPFDLDSASKMRNHFAEDILDQKMLFLMQVFMAIYVRYLYRNYILHNKSF